jgi:cyclic pyranopterin phosphate synthase
MLVLLEASKSMNERLTHFDDEGASRMVDVGSKDVTPRRAVASCRVLMQAATHQRVREGSATTKGNVLEVARLAGIMAAKRTAELIPLCHPLPLDAVAIDFDLDREETVVIRATVRTTARTGVEMEALTAATVTALTIYDMCKSIDREMTIENVRVDEKSGGRSGHFIREA